MSILWAETLGVCALAVLGFLAGRWCSRLPRPWWLLGYFVPLALIVIIGLARRNSALELTPPISWLMHGRTPFALTAVITTLILTTPLSRMPRPRDKRLVVLLMVLIVTLSAIWPFAAPIFNRNFLASIQTRLDADGICWQSTDYTCGPASAVTALRKLGLSAEEGEIAILAHTSQAMGTPPGILAETLQKRYRRYGLTCELKHFKSVAELKSAGLTLALIKFGLMVDHYLVILEVTDNTVVVGDPISGKAVLSHQQFAKKWRFSGVVLKRTDVASRPNSTRS